LRLSARNIDEAVRPGDVVSGLVRLFPAQGPVKPGSYDFAFQSYFDHRGGTGFFMGDPIKIEIAEPPSLGMRFAAEIEDLRLRITDRIRSRISGAEGEIAAALITGIRAGIPEEVNEDLRRT